MAEPKPIYECRKCGTKWVQDWRTLRPIWAPNSLECDGRIEPIPEPVTPGVAPSRYQSIERKDADDKGAQP